MALIHDFAVQGAQMTLVVAIAPLATGLVRKAKARLLRRKGPPVLQPYRDLLRLAHKDVVLAENASWLFRAAPYLIFAATWVAAALVPTFATGLLFSWTADLIAIVALLGVLYTIPNFLTKDQLAAWPAFLPHQTMTLGLDLQGGSYLLLQVNKQGIINDRLAELRRDARNLLANQNGIGNIITVKGNKLSIELTDPTQRQKADQVLQGLQNNVGGSVIGVGGTPELSFSDTADGKIAVALTDQGINQRMSSLVTQSMEVIRKRID